MSTIQLTKWHRGVTVFVHHCLMRNWDYEVKGRQWSTYICMIVSAPLVTIDPNPYHTASHSTVTNLAVPDAETLSYSPADSCPKRHASSTSI